jgi:hypothetical protein
VGAARGGMNTEHIARRTVAFFFLTSLANIVTLIVFAALYSTGALHHDPNPALTYIFGVAAAGATALIAFGLPRLGRSTAPDNPKSGWIARGVGFARDSLGLGVRDSLQMIRRRASWPARSG